MSRYKPKEPYTVPMALLIPEYAGAKGSIKKKYPEHDKALPFFGSFKTYGGTEKAVNGVLSVEDTAYIETWYRPDISAGCRIILRGNGEEYEILGQPENINMRNQYMKFKVRRVSGGA